ncbi:MAG: hypothetical protein COB85_05715 [Bacteroidetes bacterium]|nr:MAG: hypothetical protein COB85_05715 [Bacteroidota bacterium]
MKYSLKFLLAVMFLVLGGNNLFAQCNNPANEECNSAEVITLTSGDTTCVSGCNTGASTNNITLTGNSCDNISGAAVFYTFTVTDGTLDFWITADFPDIQMTLMTVDCGSFFVQGCDTGTDSTASVTAFNSAAGTTYSLVISSASGNTGDFLLCVSSYPDPSACNTGDTLTASPPPDTTGGQNPGSYGPGVTVEYCYTIDPYQKIDCNWISGIVPLFGSGWDMSTFTTTTALVSADGKGVWVWEAADSGGIAVTHNVTGDTVNATGGWFYLNNCGPCPTHNNDPNLSWGDGQCGGPCQCDEAGSGFTWQVCFEIATPDSCVQGADLSIGMKTYADGQIAWWTNFACEIDASTYIYAVSDCPSCGIDSVTTVDVLCFGDSSGSAIAYVDTLGEPPFTYSWNTSPIQTDSTATGLSAGSYTVIATDSNGCVDSASITVTEPSAIGPSITDSTMVLCFGDSTGSATVSAGGGVTPYTYLWDDNNSQTDSTATGLQAGTYEVMVTDSNGCIDSVSVVIAQPAAILNANITASTSLLCNGVPTGEITVTGAGGTTTYTYLWNDLGVQTNATATGLLAGLYQVILTDANACSDSDTISITEPPAIMLVISDTADANCGSSDGMATVTPTGGIGAYTYLWNDLSSQTDSIATGLPAAAYQVVVTDGNGCKDSISININNLGGGSASITDTTHILCNGDSIGSATITPSGGSGPYTFSWDDPDSQTDSIATGLFAGIYTGTVIDNGGCIALATVTITETTALSLVTNVIMDVACNGGMDGSVDISVTGGTTPYTYLWNDSGSQSNAIATGLQAGNYTLVVTDDNSCIDSISGTITEPSLLTISLIDSVQVACNADATGSATVSSSGGSTPYTYLWNDSNSQTDSMATGLTAGTYTAYTTDMNGCMDSVSISITEPGLLSLTVDADSASCNNYADGQIYVTITGGVSTFSFVWSTADSTINTSAISDTSGGQLAGTYSVIVTDANGCLASDSATIGQPPEISLTAFTLSNPNCNGDTDGMANVIVNTGVSPYNYMWSSGDTTLISTDAFNIVGGLAAGTYYVQVSDASGCINSDTVTITEPTVLSLTLTSIDVSCNGMSDGSTTVNVTGGTPGYSFQWNDSGTQTNATANGLAIGMYTVIVTDVKGCSNIDSVPVSEPSAMNLVMSSVSASCGTGDGEASVVVTGGASPYTYSWDDTLNQTNSTATNLAGATYTVSVLDTNGCASSASVTVATSPLIATVSSDVDICLGNVTTLTASGGTGYTWSPSVGLSATNIANPVASPSNTTLYTVVVTSGICAPDTATVNVTVNLNPTVSITSDPGGTGGGVLLTGLGASIYNWTPSAGLSCTNCPNPIATPTQTTTYTVIGTDVNGCTDTSTIEVEIGYVIFIPEIFSPSSTELPNTVAFVQGKGIQEVVTFIIYDRWGEKVFENQNFQANDPNMGWDGTFNGQLMNPAVFVYYVEAIYLNGEEYTEQGDLTLMK